MVHLQVTQEKEIFSRSSTNRMFPIMAETLTKELLSILLMAKPRNTAPHMQLPGSAVNCAILSMLSAYNER